jgi:hypothetical protein
VERQTFLIKGVRYRAGDEALQPALAQIHNTNESPYCMCRPEGVRMYVAKYADYVIKRLPDTGPQHHPACPSYELPPGESGLGELLGEAVVEHSNDAVELRVDFALTRMHGRSIERAASSAPAGTVQAARKALSLRALTHWLWEQAGFNRWYPSMTGKRNWAVVRKYVLACANTTKTKGRLLSEAMHLPEPFSLDHKDAQIARREEVFRALNSPQGDVQFRMLIVLGELADLQQTSVGGRIQVKHMPELPLLVDEALQKRLQKAFAATLQAKAADAQLRIILTALVYAKRDRVYMVDRASMMLATEHWIPVEDLAEARLARHLVQEERSFLKPLRYDARHAARFPNFKLLDTGAESTALDIVSMLADEQDRADKLEAIQSRAQPAWVWSTDQPIPPLPPKRIPQKPPAAQPAPVAG